MQGVQILQAIIGESHTLDGVKIQALVKIASDLLAQEDPAEKEIGQVDTQEWITKAVVIAFPSLDLYEATATLRALAQVHHSFSESKKAS